MTDPELDAGDSNGSEVGRVKAVQSVERALDVLSLFGTASTPSLGVTEIAHAVGLSKGVVHRILSAFRYKGFVELDTTTRRYTLGPDVLFLALGYFDRLDLRGIAHDALVQLVERTDETATLSIRLTWQGVHLDQVTPDRVVKMMVQLGTPYPLHTGASQKALLAFLPMEQQEEYLSSRELVALTRRTITDREHLREELATIRAQGFALSIGEQDESAGSVAAPIFGQDGQPAAAISVSAPVERFADNQRASTEAVLEAAAQVSHRLGHRAVERSGPTV